MSLNASLNLCQISNQELLQNTKTLVQRERQLFSEILHYLQEIQRRMLYCDLGYRSLWEYCLKALGYSESQVKRVTDAMKLVQEIPEIEEVIERGELSLSNVVAAQVHFRAETKARVDLSSDKKLKKIGFAQNRHPCGKIWQKPQSQVTSSHFKLTPSRYKLVGTKFARVTTVNLGAAKN